MNPYRSPSSLLLMICRGDNVIVFVFGVSLTGEARARFIKVKKQRVVKLESWIL